MSEEKKKEEMKEEKKEEASCPEDGVKPDAQKADEKPEAEKKPEEPEADCKPEDAEAETEAEAEGKKEAAGAEDEALNVKYLRLMADFQNFKRRTEKEKNDIYAFANEKIISELLNVIDNFERALMHGASGDSFTEGMNMIFKQLQGVLDKAGVKEIEALGLDFDPNFHNAVMTEDSTEYESGKVTEVLQKGYTLNSKVIRPSMVKVAN